MKPKLRIRFNFRLKTNFSITPVLEKRLSIQLYSRQSDEEVSGQVYHQHRGLNIVNLMPSVQNWCPLSIIHLKLVESNGIFAKKAQLYIK